MNPETLDQIDRLLAAKPTLEPAPPELHARVMGAVAERSPRPVRVDFRRPLAALGAAAAVALGAFLALRSPPAPPRAPVVASAEPLTFPIDPRPALAPVTRFVAGSLDAPVRDQIDGLLDETRRARDLVVSCLPFSKSGG